MIHSEDLTLELEDDEKVETIVVGLRYAGVQSSESPQRPRDQGGWPGKATFQSGAVVETNDEGRVVEREPGPIQVGVAPDTIDEEYVEGGTLAGLENLSDFEVVYDPAEIALAFLEANYLPPRVFGGPDTAPDFSVREPILEFLGIEDMGWTAPDAEDEIRSELADVAGEEVDDSAPPDRSRRDEYLNDHSKSDLYQAAGELGFEVDWTDTAKTELADMLADVPPSDARAAFDGEYDGDPYGESETDESDGEADEGDE